MTLANAARRLNSTRPSRLPGAVLATDACRLADPVGAMGALTPGSAVLVRDYERADRPAFVAGIAAEARRRRLLVLVAADWRLAAAVGADGVHLPEGLGRSGRLAPLLGWVRRRKGVLTMACHTPAALAVARRIEADAAVLSPVFPTLSHPGAAVLGAVRFRAWARRAGLPVHALGGIDGRRARMLMGAASGVVAIGGWQKERAARRPPFPTP